MRCAVNSASSDSIYTPVTGEPTGKDLHLVLSHITRCDLTGCYKEVAIILQISTSAEASVLLAVSLHTFSSMTVGSIYSQLELLREL